MKRSATLNPLISRHGISPGASSTDHPVECAYEVADDIGPIAMR
jgi:hypothetical protein